MNRDRILIIEGDPSTGAALRSALGERGFDAVETPSAEGALALAPSFQPAVVLADVLLPGCDGPHLATRLAELRCDASVVDAIIVASSGHDTAVTPASLVRAASR